MTATETSVRQFENAQGRVRWQPVVGDDQRVWVYVPEYTHKDWVNVGKADPFLVEIHVYWPVLYRWRWWAAFLARRRVRRVSSGTWEPAEEI